ncbi:MFS transporter [Nocardia sp. NBC_00565]|uniref:MFS transporter n=1 Tax=Nocardia sp. NBC_00565 TaxID=2975993 RepID=UPI002E80D02B|nr:MFS transporter [Nocardia sp. NBC_00565]WUC00306.1 MFS transporter [Nocardia sp. NBC_00565]
MSRSSAVLPPVGPQRVLTLITAASAVFSGIYLSTVVLYFTRIVHISPMQVGVGLSIAGAVCIIVSVLVGKLSDRRGPLGVLRVSLILAGCGTLGFLTVGDFALYLVVIPATAAAQTCVQLMISTIVTRVVTERANEFRAYIRSVLNVGIAIGIGLSAVAVQWDSADFYHVAIVIGAGCVCGSALLVGRLPALGPVAVEAESGAERWAVLRDRPYLALTLLDGVLSLQYRIQSVAIPLWIIEATTAPRWSIAAIDMLNIFIVVFFQVRASRRIDNARSGGVALRKAGWAFLLACLVLAAAHGQRGWIAVLILATGATILSIGELWQTAGGFEVSNALAPPEAIGQYLGVFGTGLRLADALGPALLTWLCIGIGVLGWSVAGLILLAAGLLAPIVVARAESRRDRYALVPAG